MSRRTGFFLGAGLFLLLALLGIYLLSIATPYQKVIKHGPAPEAQGNPYLAAEHFLAKQGRKVQRADSLQVLATLPSKGQTLVMLGSREYLTPKQTERLSQWMTQGGHLIVIAERLWDKDDQASGDLLLDPLGIEQHMSEDLGEEDQEAKKVDGETPDKPSEEPAKPATDETAATSDNDNEDPLEADNDQAKEQKTDDKPRYPELTQLYLENEDAPAYIDFDTDFHLNDGKDLAHAWANSADSTHMLQLDQGEGLLTVLTDSWIWQNANIGDYDNAWLLWYLTQDSQVTLLYRTDRDDLFSLLLKHFPQALVALALLIAAGLWAAGLRQGPLQLPINRARRQLQEHLRSSADFQLRHAGQRSLLQALQRDIQRRARRRHPGFERLGVAEQWQALGRLTRLPPGAISQAMRPQPEQRLSASEFTRQVAHLQ
ncbi:MAG: DUF4350 domain-containing protein, partial [Pseudomonadaceae bacterium]|nr:DUF4350 domain-containing protein [Pseudomonadaceae bacterium]